MNEKDQAGHGIEVDPEKIDATVNEIINMSDEEVLAKIGTDGWPSQEYINQTRLMTKDAVAHSRGICRIDESGAKHVPVNEVFQIQPDPEPFDFCEAERSVRFLKREAKRNRGKAARSIWSYGYTASAVKLEDAANSLRDAAKRLKR